MSDKMREDFEVWVVSMGGDIRLNGEYVSNVTECAWGAWQASRAALVVDLPDEKNASTKADLLDEVMQALDAVGVSYK